MKKRVIITEPSFSLLHGEESLLSRREIELIAAQAKEEILAIHRAEPANLIVADHGASAMSTETFCSLVRGDEQLRKVSIIVVSPCEQQFSDRSPPFPANAVVPAPVNTPVFFQTVERLLHILPRASFRSPLGVKFHGTQRKESFLCYANDISASGMLFDAERILRKGDVIECGFLLPDGGPVRTEAEVARIVKKGRDYDSCKYGVRFRNLSKESLVAIETYVHQRSRDHR